MKNIDLEIRIMGPLFMMKKVKKRKKDGEVILPPALPESSPFPSGVDA